MLEVVLVVKGGLAKAVFSVESNPSVAILECERVIK